MFFSTGRISFKAPNYVPVPFFANLLAAIKSGGIIDVVFPMRRCGLTTLALAVKTKLQVELNVHITELDCEEEGLKKYFDYVLKHEKELWGISPSIIVFDGAELLTEKNDQGVEIYPEWSKVISDFVESGITIVFLHCNDVAHSGQLTELATSKFQVSMWTMQEVKDLVSRSNLHVDEKGLMQLYGITGGHPYLSQRILFFAEKSEKNEITGKEIEVFVENLLQSEQARHTFNWIVKWSPKDQVSSSRIGLLKYALKKWPEIPF